MTRDEMDAVILKRWPDPSYSTQDVADEVGRARWVIRDAADRLGMLAKPYSQAMRSLRRFGPQTFAAKVRAVKRADKIERLTKTQEQAERSRIDAIFAEIGLYQDDPRAVAECGIGKKMGPSPSIDRSMVGCAAAMTAEAR